MLSYRNNRLYIEGVSVEALCRRFGTPTYVYSKTQLLDNYRRFDEAFRRVPHLICYALKANSNHTLLKELAGAGAGVDITSGGELYRSLRAGFRPGRIVYAGIGKKQEEIEYALKSGILMFNVESLEELEQINASARRLGKKARIAFRINPNVDPDTHHYITTGKSGSKFGIPFSEVLPVYKRAASLGNIDVAGIHCHIGSQITKTKPFELAARRIKGKVDELAKAGIHLGYVDLGGGLGITYKDENPPAPAELARAVLPVFKDFRGTFIFEPGRYIVGNAGIFCVKVIYRKHSGGKNFFIVDGGMNDLVRPMLYDAYHEIIPAVKGGERKIKADVVGPICESSDFLGKDRILPFIGRGGFFAVKCGGAYGYAMSSQYNSRLRAAEVLVSGGKARVIRKREEYRDLEGR